MIELPELSALMPRAGRRAPEFLEPLNNAMREFGITSRESVAAFLASAGHESADLTRLREDMWYSASRLLEVFPRYFGQATALRYAGKPEQIASRVYANRMGNGPESSGDGWAYRGGGIFQLTGRNNYTAYGAALGIDLAGQPERIVEPEIACRTAGLFWKTNKLGEHADRGDFQAVCSIINTGRIGGNPHGMPDRLARYEKALKVLA